MSEKYEVVKGTRSKRWATISLRPEVFLKLKKITNEININKLEQGKKPYTITSIIDMALTLLADNKTISFFSNER